MNVSKIYEQYKLKCKEDSVVPLGKRTFVAVFWSILDLPKFEEVVMKRVNLMCEESLPPSSFEDWIEIDNILKNNRKNLKK